MRLESNRSAITEISIAIVVTLAMSLFFASEMGLLISVALSLSLSLIPTLWYWLVYANKPAAWIVDDVLYFKTWPFSITKIRKHDLESITYFTGYEIPHDRFGPRIVDLLRVKLKGYSDWDIPITDEVDHLREKRLLNFINQYFVKIPRPKEY